MLSDRCLSVLSCLSVTLVYCGQTVGWIKMKLGIMEVGLSRGHNVLEGDPAPPQKGAQPPIFGSRLLRLSGRPSQLLLSACKITQKHETVHRRSNYYSKSQDQQLL